MGHGTLLAGRYRLEERVRSGADGSTWRAVDENRDRQVQVRLLRPGHPHAAEVVDAARRAALVADQRLARVLGVADGSLVYVVSEYVPGKDLGALVAQSPLPGETVRRIIGEAAQALDRADSRGLHHLRLGPRSIAVDREGAVKVLGTAVDAAAAGIEAGEDAARTDALDLVRLLYAGLTGRWPGAEGEGLEEAPRVAGRAVPPGDLMTGVPGDLDSLCETALAQDDGPRTPGELAAALAPWAEAAPIGFPGGLAPAGPSRPLPVLVPADEPEPEPEPEPPTLLPQEAEDQEADEPSEEVETGPDGDDETEKPWWTDPQPGARESAWTAKLEEAFAEDGPISGQLDLTSLQAPAYPVVRESGARGGEAGPLPEPAPAPAAELPEPPPTVEPAPTVEPVREPEPAATAPEPAEAPVTVPATARADTSTRADSSGLSPAAVAAAAAVVRAPADVPAFGRDPEPEQPDPFSRFFGAVATAPAPEHHPDEATATDEAPEPERTEAATATGTLPWTRAGDGDEDAGPFGPLLQAPPPDREQSRAVLIVVGVVVVIGLILAVNGLRGLSGFSLTEDEPSVPVPSVSAPPVTNVPGGSNGEQPAGGPVKISKVQPLDPQGDQEENDSRAKRAADGKDDTAWASKAYKSAAFGGLKDGIGLGLQLARTATVRQVVVHFDGSANGGRLELRTASGMSFDGTTVIAGTAIDGGTATLTVKAPVQTRYLVLWCTQLPETGNGFRLQVSEVEVR